MARPTRVTNTIRDRREQSRMTQAELARQIGVTRQTLIAIELGRYSPSLEVAFLVARTFGVGIDDIFEYAEE